MRNEFYTRSDRSGWRIWLAFLAFAVIAAFFLFSEHRLHILSVLPWALVLLACPLLHMFMHGGHGGHGRHSGHGDDDRANHEREAAGASPRSDGERRTHNH